MKLLHLSLLPLIHAISSCPSTTSLIRIHVGGTQAPLYNTVQEAVSAAEALRISGSKDRIVIYMHKSTVESVTVNKTVHRLSLVGNGHSIGCAKSAAQGIPTSQTACFTILAPDFSATNVIFRNNAGVSGKQAVAVLVSSTRVFFHSCAFRGNQDTLYVKKGDVYFRECVVQGTVDFVFGNARVMIDSSRIIVNGGSRGYAVCAPGNKMREDKKSAIVFLNSTVSSQNVPAGKLYLGRPWGNEGGECAFVHTTFIHDGSVAAAGWEVMRGSLAPDNFYLWHYESNLKTNGWVSWAKSNVKNVEEYLSRSAFFSAVGNGGCWHETLWT